MTAITAIAATLALLGILMLISGLRRMRRRQIVRGGTRGLGGGLLVALGALAGAVALNLHTYQQLSAEQPVATLTFDRLAPQRYRVLLEQPQTQTVTAYELAGDQWQLDARILRWTGLGALLGLDTRYRLERLSGRYRTVEATRSHYPTVHDLAAELGLDIWSLASRYGDWLPLADAVYGSATFLPMADGARFQVTVGRDGLIARPENPAAQRAVADWEG